MIDLVMQLQSETTRLLLVVRIIDPIVVLYMSMIWMAQMKSRLLRVMKT